MSDTTVLRLASSFLTLEDYVATTQAFAGARRGVMGYLSQSPVLDAELWHVALEAHLGTHIYAAIKAAAKDVPASYSISSSDDAASSAIKLLLESLPQLERNAAQQSLYLLCQALVAPASNNSVAGDVRRILASPVCGASVDSALLLKALGCTDEAAASIAATLLVLHKLSGPTLIGIPKPVQGGSDQQVALWPSAAKAKAFRLAQASPSAATGPTANALVEVHPFSVATASAPHCAVASPGSLPRWAGASAPSDRGRSASGSSAHGPALGGHDPHEQLMLTPAALLLALDVLVSEAAPLAAKRMQALGVPITLFGCPAIASGLLACAPWPQPASTVRWMTTLLYSDGWIAWLRLTASLLSAVQHDIAEAKTAGEVDSYLRMFPRRGAIALSRLQENMAQPCLSRARVAAALAAAAARLPCTSASGRATPSGASAGFESRLAWEVYADALCSAALGTPVQSAPALARGMAGGAAEGRGACVALLRSHYGLPVAGLVEGCTPEQLSVLKPAQTGAGKGAGAAKLYGPAIQRVPLGPLPPIPAPVDYMASLRFIHLVVGPGIPLLASSSAASSTTADAGGATAAAGGLRWNRTRSNAKSISASRAASRAGTPEGPGAGDSSNTAGPAANSAKDLLDLLKARAADAAQARGAAAAAGSAAGTGRPPLAPGAKPVRAAPGSRRPSVGSASSAQSGSGSGSASGSASGATGTGPVDFTDRPPAGITAATPAAVSVAREPSVPLNDAWTERGNSAITYPMSSAVPDHAVGLALTGVTSTPVTDAHTDDGYDHDNGDGEYDEGEDDATIRESAISAGRGPSAVVGKGRRDRRPVFVPAPGADAPALLGRAIADDAARPTPLPAATPLPHVGALPVPVLAPGASDVLLWSMGSATVNEGAGPGGLPTPGSTGASKRGFSPSLSSPMRAVSPSKAKGSGSVWGNGGAASSPSAASAGTSGSISAPQARAHDTSPARTALASLRLSAVTSGALAGMLPPLMSVGSEDESTGSSRGHTTPHSPKARFGLGMGVGAPSMGVHGFSAPKITIAPASSGAGGGKAAVGQPGQGGGLISAVLAARPPSKTPAKPAAQPRMASKAVPAELAEVDDVISDSLRVLGLGAPAISFKTTGPKDKDQEGPSGVDEALVSVATSLVASAPVSIAAIHDGRGSVQQSSADSGSTPPQASGRGRRPSDGLPLNSPVYKGGMSAAAKQRSSNGVDGGVGSPGVREAILGPVPGPQPVATQHVPTASEIYRTARPDSPHQRLREAAQALEAMGPVGSAWPTGPDQGAMTMPGPGQFGSALARPRPYELDIGIDALGSEYGHGYGDHNDGLNAFNNPAAAIQNLADELALDIAAGERKLARALGEHGGDEENDGQGQGGDGHEDEGTLGAALGAAFSMPSIQPQQADIPAFPGYPMVRHNGPGQGQADPLAWGQASSIMSLSLSMGPTRSTPGPKRAPPRRPVTASPAPGSTHLPSSTAIDGHAATTHMDDVLAGVYAAALDIGEAGWPLPEVGATRRARETGMLTGHHDESATAHGLSTSQLVAEQVPQQPPKTAPQLFDEAILSVYPEAGMTARPHATVAAVHDGTAPVHGQAAGLTPHDAGAHGYRGRSLAVALAAVAASPPHALLPNHGAGVSEYTSPRDEARDEARVETRDTAMAAAQSGYGRDNGISQQQSAAVTSTPRVPSRPAPTVALSSTAAQPRSSPSGKSSSVDQPTPNAKPSPPGKAYLGRDFNLEALSAAIQLNMAVGSGRVQAGLVGPKIGHSALALSGPAGPAAGADALRLLQDTVLGPPAPVDPPTAVPSAVEDENGAFEAGTGYGSAMASTPTVGRGLALPELHRDYPTSRLLQSALEQAGLPADCSVGSQAGGLSLQGGLSALRLQYPVGTPGTSSMTGTSSLTAASGLGRAVDAQPVPGMVSARTHLYESKVASMGRSGTAGTQDSFVTAGTAHGSADTTTAGTLSNALGYSMVLSPRLPSAQGDQLGSVVGLEAPQTPSMAVTTPARPSRLHDMHGRPKLLSELLELGTTPKAAAPGNNTSSNSVGGQAMSSAKGTAVKPLGLLKPTAPLSASERQAKAGDILAELEHGAGLGGSTIGGGNSNGSNSARSPLPSGRGPSTTFDAVGQALATPGSPVSPHHHFGLPYWRSPPKVAL